ncbi:MAG TPA: ABC transporter permease [Terriglobales bacterium]|nr:ABC transporter permease [Terriglobales bacterium]
MNRMIVANLVHRPLRSLISIVAIAVEVTLILLIVGLSIGMLNDSKARQAGIGADIMVKPPGSSVIGNLSSAPISIKVADVIKQKVPGVKAVAPVLTQFNTSGTIEILYGIDLESFQSLGKPFTYIAGGPFAGPDDILVDEYIAQSKHLKVGQTIRELNHDFRVVGVVASGKGARKFMPIKTVQELLGADGKASIFYVKLEDSKNVDAAVQQIKLIPGMSSYVVQSVEEWLSLMAPDKVPGLSSFINVVIGVAVCIGFLVIFQSMYTAVMERTREIGILKSMGASKAYVVGLILRETMLLAVLGIVLGIVFSYAASATLIRAFPTVRIMVESEWVLRATLIALVGSMLGAIYPAFRAAQKDPIDALAYE